VTKRRSLSRIGGFRSTDTLLVPLLRLISVETQTDTTSGPILLAPPSPLVVVLWPVLAASNQLPVFASLRFGCAQIESSVAFSFVRSPFVSLLNSLSHINFTFSCVLIRYPSRLPVASIPTDSCVRGIAFHRSTSNLKFGLITKCYFRLLLKLHRR
jgi:hypothetical protein